MEDRFDIQPEPLAERVAHVERSSADLHRGGRHRGRAAAAAAAAAAVVGVSVDRERQGEITRGAVGLTHDLPPDRKGSGGESAASLIQSLTVAAPHRLHCRVPIVSLFFLWGYVAFFTGA